MDEINTNNQSNNYNAEQTSKDMWRVRYFLTGCLIYSCFYTFCMYKNPSGITYPVLVLATIIVFRLFTKKLFDDAAGLFPPSCRFYEISCLLLGVSTCATDCIPVIFLNKTAVFLLMLLYFINALFDTSKWNFIQHISAALNVIFGTLGCLLNPFRDYKWYKNASAYLKGLGIDDAAARRNGFFVRNKTMIRNIALGLMVAFPLLAVIITLLRSADVLFDEMFGSIFEVIFDFHIADWISDLFANLFGIVFMTAAAFIVSYAVWSFLGRRSINESTAKEGTFEPVTAITFTGLLAVVYVMFSFIQIFGLFLGNMKLPDNYTYAEYARQGFFQLLFICILNIIIVLVCLYCFKKSNILKALLTVISVCTYIMTASSAMRMIMYIRAYRLTFLRIAVLWGLTLIAVIITGILIYIYNKNFRLFRYCVVWTTVLYIAFSYSHPDLISAAYNFEHINLSKPKNDITYILELSDDAAPVIMSSDFKEFCASSGYGMTYKYYTQERREPAGIRTLNLSRFIAYIMQ